VAQAPSVRAGIQKAFREECFRRAYGGSPRIPDEVMARMADWLDASPAMFMSDAELDRRRREPWLIDYASVERRMLACPCDRHSPVVEPGRALAAELQGDRQSRMLRPLDEWAIEAEELIRERRPLDPDALPTVEQERHRVTQAARSLRYLDPDPEPAPPWAKPLAPPRKP